MIPDTSTAYHLARLCAAVAKGNAAIAEDAIIAVMGISDEGHRQCYEAILQTYLFAGFPAALEGLVLLYNVTGIYPDAMAADDDVAVRGEQLCKAIYTTAYGKMRERLGRIAPDLDHRMVLEGYGNTLSRGGLSIVYRELCVVAVLSVTGWSNQLYSHIRGCMNLGLSAPDIQSVIIPVIRDVAPANEALFTATFSKVVQ